MKKTILIVEDNKKLASLFAQALTDRFDIRIAHTIKDAKGVSFSGINGVLLDLQLPDGDGLELIKPAKAQNPSCIIIVATAYGTIQRTVEAMRLGAADFIEKPVDIEAMIELFAERIPLAASVEPVAVSAQMIEVLKMAKLVASTRLPVLITGETGTGKDVLARFIHQESGRDSFMAINCANFTSELADSLLFGHIKGSFTGAIDTRQGLISKADKGTLFLDEIGDLPSSIQPKFLRFLDTGLYMQVGSPKEYKSSARVIAATNYDLQRRVEEGFFREDLYFRLASFPIHIPPLRERPEDIIPLAKMHIKETESVMGSIITLDKEAETLLSQYSYPGNVRELFNTIDRIAVLTGGDITGVTLKSILASGVNKYEPKGDFWSESRMEALKKEKELIQTALAAADGNKSAAARMLKISYKTLFNKMKQFGM
jgi:DNA-binding NtrC family response regulator